MNKGNFLMGKGIVDIRFPDITAKTLAGNTITLPGSAKGKITLVTMAFVRDAQTMIDSWLKPFEKEFGQDDSFTFYEVPMIASSWKKFSWVIDSGMRGGIAKEKHNNVMTYYGDYDNYRKKLSMYNKNLAYAFLLDQEGVIRWAGKGYAIHETEKEMIETAISLLEYDRQ
jgi:hypothetical protein